MVNDGKPPGVEVWKEIDGFDGKYSVSDLGRVRSNDRIVHSTSGQIYGVKGKILKCSPGNHGYRVASLWKDGKHHRQLVHRLVLEAFVGECPDGMECCHNNGNPLDNRVENLRWGTSSDNTQDIIRHGNMYQLSVTHCPSGHEYTKDNIYLYQGRRYCRACRSGGRKVHERRKTYSGTNC